MCKNFNLEKSYLITILKLALLNAMLIFAFSISARAETIKSGQCGTYAYYTLDDNGNLRIYGSKTMYDFSYSNNGTVVFCSVPWYSMKEDVKSVVIESGITSVGEYSFYNCTNLEEITISDTVTKIGERSFLNCASLTSVEIPDSVVNIYSFAFGNCSGLTSVKLSQNLTSISTHAFQSCSNLVRINLPDSLTYIGILAFWGCDNLRWAVIPESVTKIYDDSFEDCDNLKYVYCYKSSTADDKSLYPSGVSLIYMDDIEIIDSGYCGEDLIYVLYSEGTLVISGTGEMDDAPWDSNSVITLIIENGATSICDWAFSYCRNMTYAEIPSSVESIGNLSFYMTGSLETVNLSNGLKTIGQSAFLQSGLPSITLPDTVIDIDCRAFAACTNLTDINLPIGITELSDDLFGYCTSLTSITIPDSVTSIGSGTFYLCESLSYIEIPESVSYVGMSAFQDCTGFTSITIPESVENIDYNAFGGCTNLSEIALSEGLITIGDYAFKNCEKLTEITIPGSATSLGEYIFYGCTNLKNIVLSDGVDNIGNRTFSYCSALEEIYIPESVSSIGEEAFYTCDSLTNITIPSGVTYIGVRAFCSCKKLSNITLSEGLDVLDMYAFSSCVNLLSIDIPNSVNTISQYAFCNCINLKNIVLPNNIKIYNSAYYNCPSLSTVYFKGTETEWEDLSIYYAGNQNLTYADVVYLYQYDSETGVEISAEDVLGGVKITLSSDNAQAIYYTTDGTIPTTRSKVYEKSVTLTDAGTYTIEAMSYDGEAYSEISEKTIVVKQATKPAISCNNGAVTITAEDGASIYYNYSLTPPTTSSSVYSEAFTVPTSTYVTAVAIKVGYAKSSSTSLYCVGTEEKEEYQPLRDSYSFTNTPKSLTGKMTSYRSLSAYTSVFGETLGTTLYKNYEYNESGDLIKSGGSCFGMALTSALFYTNGLAVDEYSSSDYESVYDIPAPKSADSALTKLIERCQVSQFLPAFQTKMTSDALKKGDLSEIVSAVQNCGNEPIIIYICRMNDGVISGHAVLPYKVENSSEDSDIWYIYVYDCDMPNTENGDENYITIDLSDNSFFYRGKYTYSYGISCAKISSLLDDDTVSLLEDEVVENNASIMDGNFLFITNSNDVTIYNADGTEAESISGAVKYNTVGVEDSTGIMWLLPDDDYTVVNNDSSISRLKATVVDEVDSFTLTTDDLSAETAFGRYDDRLYISSASASEADITIDTYNSTKKDNSISLCSDYVYVKPYNDNIIELYTNTDVITANNIEFSLDAYSGSFVDADNMILVNKNAASEVEKNCEISVISKPQISGSTFSGTLKLNLVNNGEVSESGTLYTALCGSDSNKILFEQSQTVTDLIPGESRNVTFSVNAVLSETAEEYVLKVMLWDENMQPVSDSIEMTY